MPAVVALAIRALIQIAITLGLISLAENVVFPLIHKAIQEIMVFFGVAEETAKDIMANEILATVETLGIGIVTLRTKLPTRIAEYLGFTSKGWSKRILVGKIANIKGGATISKAITQVETIVPSAAEITSILSKAKIVIPGFLAASNFFFKTLGLTFLGFIAFNNLVDFGNWNSGAYQKTFQRIFAKISGGLLVPDEDYRQTKTVSPEVFDKVYNTYKIEGAVGINDPYKKTPLPFTRDNLIDLLDVIGADLLRTQQRASTKDVLLASQLFITFKESKEAPATITATAAAAAIPQVRVFTGILTQGKLGETDPFIAREDDLIDSMEDLRLAAENNLSSFLVALPGKIVYELKVVPTITTKDGFKQRGMNQRIISGYTKDGAPKYKNVINKFAVIDIYVFTARNIKTKIQQVVLGPTDAVKFQPNVNDIQATEKSIRENIVTSDIQKIETIITPLPPTISTPTPAPAPALPQTITPTPAMAPSIKVEPVPAPVQAPPVSVGISKTIYNDFGVFDQAFKNKYGDPSPGISYWKERLNFPDWMKDLEAYAPTTPTPTITPAPAGLPWPSNNPNKCNAWTISEFFDTARIKYPLLAERAPYYEQWGLGQAAYYTGTAEQNNKFLTELKRRSGC